MNARSKRLSRIGTVLAVLLLLFFLGVPLLSGVLVKLVPDSVLDKAGAQIIDSARDDKPYCTDVEGAKALDALVDRLATASGGNVRFRVYVVDDDVLNAFAAAGGHVVIYRRIIEEAQGPEELAGVLAHEMSHELEGHPNKALVEAMGYGVFSLLTPGGDEIGSQVAAAVVTSVYSRSDELDADRRGVELLNTAGIDSRGLARFFDTMKAKGNDIPGALEFVSSHPTGEHRQAAVKDIEKAGDPAMDPAAWAALRGICKSTSSSAAPVGQ
jgi:beta-barrel assembly-enhancing protease